MPVFLKATSVFLTYLRSVVASGAGVVGHAAGGGCLLGSAHEFLRASVLKVTSSSDDYRTRLTRSGNQDRS